MKMSILEEILNIKTEELKKKTYEEFVALQDNFLGFTTNYKSKSFYFEVHLIKKDNEILARIQCSRDILILRCFSLSKYFSISETGIVKDIPGEVYEWTK